MSETEPNSKFELWVPDKCLHEPLKEYVIDLRRAPLRIRGLWHRPAGMAQTGRSNPWSEFSWSLLKKTSYINLSQLKQPHYLVWSCRRLGGKF